jgi:ABC-type uncharacterized transport system substrate-binding protein
VTGDDPVRAGLVVSLSRPGGNLTGVTFFGSGNLTTKRLEILHELAPKAEVIAVLIDPTYPGSEADLPVVEAAARALGRRTLARRVRYAGRILKGAKVSELPVLQPTAFEFAINLKTAKALGLTVPNTLLVSADEVVE